MTVPTSAIPAYASGNTNAMSMPAASPGCPADRVGEQVSEPDAEQPAGDRDDEALGGEDAPDIVVSWAF